MKQFRQLFFDEGVLDSDSKQHKTLALYSVNIISLMISIQIMSVDVKKSDRRRVKN